VAAAFDHYDSREHDPQLQTHVVIANRVQGEDGRWRTLDSRGVLFPSVVALSETCDDLLADHLTRELGVRWHLYLQELTGVSAGVVVEELPR
jgi:conjugative relaxase-like TrwC/TraI family protein